MSTERIVIDRSVAEDFAERLAECTSSLRVGDPSEAETQIGPLMNEAAVRRVAEHVDDAASKGAKLITGGEAEDRMRVYSRSRSDRW